jgi:hypothetical protein
MTIEIEFRTTRVYETDDKNEALQWAKEDIEQKNITGDSLDISFLED